MLYNSGTGIYKFGNNNYPQVEFRSHFLGKKVRLMGQEILYIAQKYSKTDNILQYASLGIS